MVLDDFSKTNIVYCMGGDTFYASFETSPKTSFCKQFPGFWKLFVLPFLFRVLHRCFQLVLRDLGLALVAHSLALHHHKFFGLSAAELATGQMPPPRQLNIYSPPHKA
jgi:hypothetical protein